MELLKLYFNPLAVWRNYFIRNHFAPFLWSQVRVFFQLATETLNGKRQGRGFDV